MESAKDVVKAERRRIKDAVENSTLPNKKDVLDVIFPPTATTAASPSRVTWTDLSK